jgi:perosamine synthetase
MSKVYNIPQMEPWFGIEEITEINSYLSGGGWMTEFKKTVNFERLIAEYTNSKHCIVVNNGTISLTLAAIACGIEPGDEVIVPNYTMIATPNSVKMIGAIPVFVDVEPETLCINIDLIEEKITNKTKALIFVSANGRYPNYNIDELVSLCDKYNIKLIEDAAQSLGSFYKDGTHIGLKGNVGSFSFSAPKIISTGQGGALITNDDECAYKLSRLKDFGRSNGGNDIHDTIGFNFKFTELQACVGIAQMGKLEWRVKRKKEIYLLYKNILKDCNEIKFFDQDLTTTTPWFIDVLVTKRESLIEYLKNNGIGTRTMYPPINNQKAYMEKGSFPVAEKIGLNGLWLPSANQLTNQDIEYICDRIIDFYK